MHLYFDFPLFINVYFEYRFRLSRCGECRYVEIDLDCEHKLLLDLFKLKLMILVDTHNF